MVNYLTELKELKPKCQLVKGYLDTRSKLMWTKNPGTSQELEAPGTRESSSKVAGQKQGNWLKICMKNNGTHALAPTKSTPASTSLPQPKERNLTRVSKLWDTRHGRNEGWSTRLITLYLIVKVYVLLSWTIWSGWYST